MSDIFLADELINKIRAMEVRLHFKGEQARLNQKLSGFHL